jgi:hydroxymethylbilane synthase
MPDILIATRGSALALAQANAVLSQCRKKFPGETFALKIMKTTGDKLQTAAPSKIAATIPKGLFTKELEAALLERRADLAVHSLKDLPTDLPTGLVLAAVAGKREDVRDVLICCAAKLGAKVTTLDGLPEGLVVATGSERRKAQLLALRPDFKTVDIRGNVPTRLKKLAAAGAFQATILAAAGMSRLGIHINESGVLDGEDVPAGLIAIFLEPAQMLPCVGQGAIGLEIRQEDSRLMQICEALNDADTFACVTAERAFLRAMGGGCQTPVGAHATIKNGRMHLSAVAHLTEHVRRAEDDAPVTEAEALGTRVAARIR